ncbi:hypothetical protein [Flavobacterium hibisci]|uniref:hypothetical protein n=1 Tax=Flavobacterium hibisci TaxID=1914462 RepID=UPI001CC18BBF|nr:hypothetical protein [Flavobacterium hibisci]MBZ4043939.1 hypothetical protein [Flavobacterium hibisci]
MKSLKLFLLTLFIGASQLHAQAKVESIIYKFHPHYMTTDIGQTVAGTYLIEGKKQPVIEINADGTGIIQLANLSKKKLTWGIECSDEGIPIFKEGYDSSSYTFWYKITGTGEWLYTQFLIIPGKKKMYLMGDRVKYYGETQVKNEEE